MIKLKETPIFRDITSCSPLKVDVLEEHVDSLEAERIS
jgi:hypothetical protein